VSCGRFYPKTSLSIGRPRGAKKKREREKKKIEDRSGSSLMGQPPRGRPNTEEKGEKRKKEKE